MIQLNEYTEAAQTLTKMPLDYAVVHFDCDDGMMLYGIPKTIKFANGDYLGNSTWVLINSQGMRKETFEQKIRDYVKTFEDKGHKVTITLI